MNEWITEYEGVDITTVQIVERKLEIMFPSDYIDFIRLYQGGRPKKGELVIKNNKVNLEYLLVFIAFDELDILDKYNETKKYLFKNIIPFAITSDNGILCFLFLPNKTLESIVYVDINKARNKDEDCIVFICKTFTELLQILESR